MADTIGDMIDKLTIANIRIWHLEDEKRKLTNAIKDVDLNNLKIITEKVSKTNRERNDLIDQINSGLRVLMDKVNDKESNFIINADSLLGNNKNKFYKGEDS